MKITFTFMRGMDQLAQVTGQSNKDVVNGTSDKFTSEQLMASLLEVEKLVNANSNLRLHIWTEPEEHDAKD